MHSGLSTSTEELVLLGHWTSVLLGPMLLQMALLLFALFIGKFDASTKPILCLQPPWTTVFKNEKIKLICEHLDLVEFGEILWYNKGKKFLQTPGNTTVISESGNYSCRSQNSAPSDSVNIIFSNEWLILQIPYSVFEGDAVNLKCQGWKKAKLSQVTFHKGKEFIYYTKENKPLPIKAAKREHSGHYSCSGYMPEGKVNKSSKPAVLQVQELFPQPELRIKNSTETMEKYSTALSCETRLPPQRSASQLYFSFYKDNSTIRGSNHSPEYYIPETIMRDTGLYWCEAATEDGQVKKKSLSLEIQGSTSTSIPLGYMNSQLVLGIVLALVGMIGITAALLLYFRIVKKAEGTTAPDPTRGLFIPGAPEAPKASLSQDLESYPVYTNVSAPDEETGDVIYSVVFPKEQRKKDPN